MCLSPHEMTTAQIEEILAYYRKSVEDAESKIEEIKESVVISPRGREQQLALYARSLRRANSYLERYETLLKERAEEGRMIEEDAL